MLIVSRFHDYYDTAIGLGGVDKTVVYQRDEKDLRKRKRSIRETAAGFYVYKSGPRLEIYVQGVIVGFCGDLYPAFGFYVGSADPYFVYSAEDAIKEFDSLGINIKEKDRYKSFSFEKSYTRISSIDSIRSYFSEDPFNKQKAMSAFIENKVPVFYYLVGDDNFVLNPSLKKLSFQRVKDAFTAFQEIHGFISGVLGVDARPMVELSDKSKIEKHGFFKWSFRKEPWKKVKKNPNSR